MAIVVITLHDELMMLDSCNFELDEVVQIPIIDYYKTIKEHWRNNVKSNRVFLENITSVSMFGISNFT